MARMRVIGSSFDKGYRDDLNYNFGLLEALIGEANGLTDALRREMLNYINNLQQQINILTGENIDELLARLNDSIQQALTAAQEARTAKTATEEATALAKAATELANASALLAEEKANYANEKAVLAQEAADNANQEASNLSQLKIDVVQATQSANEEANNANEKATFANNAADRANQAADNAEEAASKANLAADAISGWGTAEKWVNDKQYQRNNIVTDNGSTWQALRPNIGVTPVEGQDWTCLARKGLDGTGAVSSVNNRYPGSDGNVEVKWSDIPEKPTTFLPSAHTHEINDVTGLQDILDRKANEVDLNNLEQIVTQNQQVINDHLTEIFSEYIVASRDLTLIGDQVITGFSGKPKAIIIDAVVSGTSKTSTGRVASNDQYRITSFANESGIVNYVGGGMSVLIMDSLTNYTAGVITINDDSTITIKWSKSGTGATGTVSMRILALYHGDRKGIGGFPVTWYGKKANFIGDSITSGVNETYVSTVKKILGLSVARNYGVGGSSLCYRDSLSDTNYPPVLSRFEDMDDDADIIFVLIGTNDYSSQVPLGNMNSTNPAEFYGGLNLLLDGLRIKYPDKLVVISNILRRINPNKTIPLSTYNDAIETKCKEKGFIVFDAYNGIGLDFNADYSTKITTLDGLHPNAKGNDILGHRIASFINSK